jgi:uncharacterized membrane protein YtjA (UPF0391 family)
MKERFEMNVSGRSSRFRGQFLAGKLSQHCTGTRVPWARSEDIGSLISGAPPMGNMLYYAIVFLVVALVAAFLGFGGVAGTAMEGARLLFWVAIILFVVSLIAGIIRKA